MKLPLLVSALVDRFHIPFMVNAFVDRYRIPFVVNAFVDCYQKCAFVRKAHLHYQRSLSVDET